MWPTWTFAWLTTTGLRDDIPSSYYCVVVKYLIFLLRFLLIGFGGFLYFVLQVQHEFLFAAQTLLGHEQLL